MPCDSHKLWEASLHAQAVPSPTDLLPAHQVGGGGALPTLVPAAPNTEPVTGFVIASMSLFTRASMG